MSSTWKDERIKAWNVVKGNQYSAKMFGGPNSCIHTMNDKEGAWWRGNFGRKITVTYV